MGWARSEELNRGKTRGEKGRGQRRVEERKGKEGNGKQRVGGERGRRRAKKYRSAEREGDRRGEEEEEVRSPEGRAALGASTHLAS